MPRNKKEDDPFSDISGPSKKEREPKPDKPAPAKLPNGDNEISEADEMKARLEAKTPFMKEFFNKVEQIKRNMDQIKKNMSALEKKHGTALTSMSSKKSEKQNEEIEDMMDQTSTLIKAVKESLKELDNESKENQKKGKKDAEARTRQNMYTTLCKRFIELVQEYQDMQTNFKQKYKDRVGRQLKV